MPGQFTTEDYEVLHFRLSVGLKKIEIAGRQELGWGAQKPRPPADCRRPLGYAPDPRPKTKFLFVF